MRLAMLAGWLFADLFLVLFLIALALLPPHPTPSASPSGSAEPSATTASSPSPSPSPSSAAIRPPVLDRVPTDLRIPMNLADLDAGPGGPGAARLLDELNRQLAERGATGRRCGVVLVFVAGPSTPAGIGTAVDRARRALDILRGRHAAFADASGDAYWSGGADFVELKIFFFA
jgi:hypothetical protein